ncbi:GlxA family transcriptional regulator [Paracoccus benzoatiresistens]|uniref:Helix-turn-helix domain-containing protein n=1 Tax=Paracoccus benzoatiresistens TaxID=2997341 RepID=A0ABT4J9Q3_9RHOB|nr:helix-turn-helix domain-containing protein [Paracoccus sp. EF6]MCZ0963811.1 helix-turn-helix domain-containing protein [Paracoccus sp. EF6]
MRVAFLLFEGFSNMVLSCLLEPLRAVRDQGQADLHWQVLTADGNSVRSSSGLLVAPDGGARGAFDLLIVVSGYGFRDHARGNGLRHVLALSRRSLIVVGADTGAWLLAAAGLLSGQRATIHWSLVPEFAEAFPNVQVGALPSVMEGRVWSCGDASAALELILDLIEKRFGKGSAFLASSMFLHEADHSSGGSRAGTLWPARKAPARLHQVIDLMVEKIEMPIPIAQIAAQSGFSLSSMERQFRAETGMSPGRYFQMLRLTRARDLVLGTDLDFRSIALRCGYANASALGKAYKSAFACPIRQLRRRHQT